MKLSLVLVTLVDRVARPCRRHWYTLNAGTYRAGEAEQFRAIPHYSNDLTETMEGVSQNCILVSRK